MKIVLNFLLRHQVLESVSFFGVLVLTLVMMLNMIITHLLPRLCLPQNPMYVLIKYNLVLLKPYVKSAVMLQSKMIVVRKIIANGLPLSKLILTLI